MIPPEALVLLVLAAVGLALAPVFSDAAERWWMVLLACTLHLGVRRVAGAVPGGPILVGLTLAVVGYAVLLAALETAR